MTGLALDRLLERLAELALVELDTLVGRLPENVVAEVIAAYVADLEHALSEARTILRARASGTDPLALLDLGAERRVRAGEPTFADAAARLGERAAERRDLARLEEAVRGVLPRLLEADRRLAALA